VTLASCAKIASYGKIKFPQEHAATICPLTDEEYSEILRMAGNVASPGFLCPENRLADTRKAFLESQYSKRDELRVELVPNIEGEISMRRAIVFLLLAALGWAIFALGVMHPDSVSFAQQRKAAPRDGRSKESGGQNSCGGHDLRN